MHSEGSLVVKWLGFSAQRHGPGSIPSHETTPPPRKKKMHSQFPHNLLTTDLIIMHQFILFSNEESPIRDKLHNSNIYIYY